MPYIEKQRREEITFKWLPQNAGELNFALTDIVKYYLGKNPNYQKFNDVIGVLQCMILELYRRKVAPYEDVKIKENGDVY
jgi:hypothetical protein